MALQGGRALVRLAGVLPASSCAASRLPWQRGDLLCASCSDYSAGIQPMSTTATENIGNTDSSWPADDARKRLVNRLLYRSKQRGFLEMDLLIGLWAERNVPHLEPKMLTAFQVDVSSTTMQAVLEQENPDLYKWLTGQEQVPTEMQQNPAFLALQKDVMRQLAEHSQRGARADPGKEWVRGWDEWKKPAKAKPS